MASSGPGASRNPTPKASETTDVIAKSVLSFIRSNPSSSRLAQSGAGPIKHFPAAVFPKTVIRRAAAEQAAELVIQTLPHLAGSVVVGKLGHQQQLCGIGGIAIDVVASGSYLLSPPKQDFAAD